MDIATTIRYNKGDIVCYRERVICGYGGYLTQVIEIIPLVVLRVYRDLRYEDRHGELGGCHKYLVKPVISLYPEVSLDNSKLREFKVYQYEIQPWVDIKDKVIRSIREVSELMNRI